MAFAAVDGTPISPGPDASPTQSFSSQPPSSTISELPKPLSEADAEHYRQIFALEREGNWRGADGEIAKLENKLLLGHVLAQRYLHPRLYHATRPELAEWLAKYLDLPEATQIYALALKRKVKNAKPLPRPTGGYLAGLGAADFGSEAESPRHERENLSAADERKAQVLKSRIRSHIRAGWPTGAKQLLDTAEAQRLLDPVEVDDALADIAAGYFAYGKDEDALDTAEAAAQRSKLPEAHWTAGIAAWRLNRFELATRHFEAVAKSPYASKWDIAAAAFWAARANLVTRHPAEVSHWLLIAAEQGRSFYGLLARRALGMDFDFNWSAPILDTTALQRVTEKAGGTRALALVQTGEQHRAESELRKLYAAADPQLADAIFALALHGEFPGLAMRIGVEQVRNGNGISDAALYPVPAWQPAGGYSLDRALMYAVIRQESRFDAGAQSSAGARGLMQIMPGTARFIVDNVADGEVDEDYELFDPNTNITMGQKYLAHLLEDDAVHGDLLLLAAAYNGGPAKLAEWQRKIDNHGDPLLFIESIPSRETRGFVERVMANMWIYELHLGQPTPSLDTVASGLWPVYSALDKRDVKVADRSGPE